MAGLSGNSQRLQPTRATQGENLAEIVYFLNSCKFQGWIGQMSKRIYQVESRTQHLIYFWRALITVLTPLVNHAPSHFNTIGQCEAELLML